MNLPDSALTFLDEFIGLYGSNPQLKTDPEFKLPIIHVHCFEKFENNENPTPEELHNRVYEKICKLIQFPLNKRKWNFMKLEWFLLQSQCFVSFELPEEVAFKQTK